jgi:hypothetical protein
MLMNALLFWIGLSIVFYAYVGYGIVLYALVWWKRRLQKTPAAPAVKIKPGGGGNARPFQHGRRKGCAVIGER